MSVIELQGINLSERIEEFLKGFEKDGREKYREYIRRMSIEKSVSLVIDFNDLLTYDRFLADIFIEKPETFLEAASEAIMAVMRTENPQYAEEVDKFYARVRGLPEYLHVGIRDIRARHIGKVVSVEGIITKITPVKQQLKVAVFRCKTCGYEERVEQGEGGLTKPSKCPRCEEEGRKSAGFTLVIEKSEFEDVQKFMLQEKPEELPPGQLPRSIEVIVRNDLVDTIRPGDRAVVVGFIRVAEDRRLMRNSPLIFHPYMEAIHVEVSTKENLDVEITPLDEKAILELAKRPDVRDRIIDAIAPSIYGYKEIKKAIALLLFGGVPKVYPDGVRVRGDIHILLVGDPGTAKSQLLRYAASIAPRGIYTTGKGATAAGLTAAVVREKSSGEFYLEAGALVLADGGVAAIDEFDKMEARDRVSIHEAMEQQTVSIAKAGIVATLNARASILAAANPAFGRYLFNKTIAENIDLPVTILSRFDLIFVIQDRPDKKRDKELAEYVLDFHRGAYPDIIDNLISSSLLKKYIAYARRYIKPKLTEEAKKKIVEYYVSMRAKSESPDAPIAITPRQLEALIRLSEAHAKMALKEVVTAEDAEAAIELMEYFLRNVGVDTATKAIDIDVVMTGKPKSQREKIVFILDLVKDLVRENDGKPVAKDVVVKKAVEHGIEEHFARRVLEELIKNGELFEAEPGYVMKV